jgi:hypothetical protein
VKEMKDGRILPQRRPYQDRFQEFLEGFKEYERKYLIEKAQDEFLDAFSKWLKTRSLKDKLEAIRKGMQLEALDSTFSLKTIFPLK